MRHGEWTNTPYRSESRTGATLYGLPYDTSGLSLFAGFLPGPTDEELDANAPDALMVKFTKRVLEALYVEITKSRERMHQHSRAEAEYWEEYCRVRALMDLWEHYYERLHHYRQPKKYPLPKSVGMYSY